MINFLREFFKAGIKDNKSLAKAIMTGVLRTAFGSLVSSLNNMKIFSVLNDDALTVSKIHNYTNLYVDCEIRIPNLEVYGAYVHHTHSSFRLRESIAELMDHKG